MVEENTQLGENIDKNKESEAKVTDKVDTKDEPEQSEKSFMSKFWSRFLNFLNANAFVVEVTIVIILAYIYPPLGAQYLAPQITASWLAVVFIFVLSGLGLKTEELSKAFQRFQFNIFVQLFNFLVTSSIVFGISRFLISVNALPQALADGMVISACLPMTINMVIVLTKSSGGDEAAAVFSAAFGNLIGVFLTPVLILGYLGVQGDIDLLSVFIKLALKVVVPVFVGQILQKFVPPVVAFVKKYKPKFKQVQQWCLVFIVYTVFCKTFRGDNQVGEVGLGSAFAMIAIQFCILCLVMTIAWFALKLFFRDEPALRVMGLYGCTHKTVAMGIPMITAIYETNPNVGLYTLPLLVWHPTQLVIGSALAPKLMKFVEDEQNRLKGSEEAEGDIEV